VNALIAQNIAENAMQGSTPCCSIAQGYASTPAPAAAMNKLTQQTTSMLGRTLVRDDKRGLLMKNRGLLERSHSLINKHMIV
jgi:hypothetical protein